MKKMTRVAHITSGGDCQGLNAAIRGVGKALLEKLENIEIFGMYDGYRGLIESDYKFMTSKDFSGILTEGGTIRVSGSTSVAPLMGELAPAYEAAVKEQKNIEVTVTVEQGGSSVGISDVRGDKSALGMVSRELTAEEKSEFGNSAIAISQIVKHSQKYFKQQQNVLGRLNGHIEEVYAGHSIVKIFGSERKVTDKFARYNNGLYQSAWKSQFISGLIFPTMHFIGNLGYVATTVLGGSLVLKGYIQVGDVQAFIQYIQQFNQPVMQIANISSVIQSTVAAAERVFEFLEQPDEEITWEGDGEVLDHVTGQVTFDHIKFGYDEDRVIIHDFSADVKPGQKIAIVGPTGAGKTTMINLLMRFYDPDSGSIKLDGVDTTKMSRSNVRKNFGMVLQDTWLFSGTVKENLLYGKPDATDEELHTAVKAARADHVISALPEGYNTMLDENANNVSAGEKQLLTIARAMLANAPILILDEATSNVDTRTETLIQSAMDELMKGRTSFIIAHRLSTIRNADLILVLNHGDIIESGNHESLMKQNGFYANLYNSQFAE